MKRLKGLFLILFLTGCFKKSPDSSEKNQSKNPILSSSADKMLENATNKKISAFTKEEREALYFAASLEREALKILTKNQNFDEQTFFSVLSYAAEIESGVKKAKPLRLDCGLYRIETDPFKPRLRRFYKTCQKPEPLIAQIEAGLNPQELQVLFFVKEWASVIGLPVTLTGENPVCDLKLSNKKLVEFQCRHWRRTLGLSASSTQELRLQTFLFQRQNQNQMHLQGGVFKDLVENRKIEVKVPLEGKIKRIEKELEVIDQFAEEARKAEAPVAESDSSLVAPAAPPFSDTSTPSQSNESANPDQASGQRTTRPAGRGAPKKAPLAPIHQGDINENQNEGEGQAENNIQTENSGEENGQEGRQDDQQESQSAGQPESQIENQPLQQEPNGEGGQIQNGREGEGNYENQQPSGSGRRASRGR